MKDFHEIVTEAGRSVSIIKGRRKKWKKVSDDSPDKEPMRPRYSYINLHDRLPPLKRWLSKQVGRPWNIIYSELSKISFRSVAGEHIKSHIEGWVEKYPIYMDGKPYHPISHNRPYNYHVREDQFYVDKNGILRKGFRKEYKYKIDKYTKTIDGITYYITDKGLKLIAKRIDNDAYLSKDYWKYLVRDDRYSPWRMMTLKIDFGKRQYEDMVLGPFEVVYK